MWSMQKYSSNKKCEDKMVGFTAQGPFCYVYQQPMLFLPVMVPTKTEHFQEREEIRCS